MRKKNVFMFLGVAVLALLTAGTLFAGGDSELPYGGVIKVGNVAPMTGDIPKVGETGANAMRMVLDEINAKGGLKVGDQTYKLEMVLEDNESKAESAVAAATKLITEDEVLAIIGSYSSKQAIPMGEVANNNETPAISPWSTNPRTTKNRPWVFRACFLDPYQAKVAAEFAKDEYKVDKVAVLFDIASDYPKGLAENFKAAAEANGMTVVAYESFTTKDIDFSSQLTKIMSSGAEMLFTPQYYNEVPLILKQAKDLGFDKPIMGSDSWGSAEVVKLSEGLASGRFFTSHYAAKGATGETKKFIDKYEAAYNETPDDVGGLTWDATNVLLKAIENTGGLSGDLAKDRMAIRDQLAKVQKWDGATGLMSFTEDGDPIKAVVIVKINDAGDFEFYKTFVPESLK